MIVVTGMHRGGTSLLANLLLELGVPMGDPQGFYRADQWNPRGYFEQADVLDFNNQVVTGHPYTQGGFRQRLGQVRYVAQPGPARLARRFEAAREEAQRLANRYEGVAVKDPRFCLTWKLWHAQGWVESIVVCMRHPLHSARSLQRRQRIPTSLGVRFWAYHMQALLEGIEALPCLVVDTDRLARGDSADELAAICAFFGLTHSAGEQERIYREVFDPSLNHSVKAPQALPSLAQPLWQQLEALRDRTRARAQ